MVGLGGLVQVFEDMKSGKMSREDFRQHIQDVCKCEKCATVDSRVLMIHHIVPRADDGTDDPDNLMVLCYNCHRITHIDLSVRGAAGSLMNKIVYYLLMDYRTKRGDEDVWSERGLAAIMKEETRYDKRPRAKEKGVTRDTLEDSEVRLGAETVDRTRIPDTFTEVENILIGMSECVRRCSNCGMNKEHNVVSGPNEIRFGRVDATKYYVCKECGTATKKAKTITPVITERD